MRSLSLRRPAAAAVARRNAVVGPLLRAGDAAVAARTSVSFFCFYFSLRSTVAGLLSRSDGGRLSPSFFLRWFV